MGVLDGVELNTLVYSINLPGGSAGSVVRERLLEDRRVGGEQMGRPILTVGRLARRDGTRQCQTRGSVN
jgi:hypothetical protein